ncbi:MAG TPA: hypothetical protein V6D16_11530, partial [Candidatus Obscuribacterales bacterium]
VAWRGDRNECAHGLVKSSPGDSTRPVEEFRNKARDCALPGRQLARDLCSWTQSQKTKIRDRVLQEVASYEN